MKKIFLLIILFFFFTKLQGQKILFVGNSLTYTNNMPSILEEIGKSFDKKIITKMICKPNYAIIDHLNEGIIQQEIASKEYDLVIIQQGPSSQKQGREMLINDGRKIAKVCSKNNTMLGYFMVWPSKQYYFTFNKVIKNHTEAAKKNNALLFPVGKYWKQYEKLKNKTSLYNQDLFHPSKAGSLLAALTIFKVLYPNKNLNKLSFVKIKYWIEQKESFNAMIHLLEK